MNVIKFAIAAALLAPAAPAAAQTASDASCILVANAFAKASKDPKEQKAAEAAMYFYLGRVKDGATAAQLKALFESASKTLNDNNAGSTMSACVQTIQTKAQLLQSLAPAPAPAASQPQKPQAQPQGR